MERILKRGGNYSPEKWFETLHLLSTFKTTNFKDLNKNFKGVSDEKI